MWHMPAAQQHSLRSSSSLVRQLRGHLSYISTEQHLQRQLLGAAVSCLPHALQPAGCAATVTSMQQQPNPAHRHPSLCLLARSTP